MEYTSTTQSFRQPNPQRLTKRLLKFLLPFMFFMIFLVWIVIPVSYSVLWSLVDPKAGWSYPDLLPRGLSTFHWEYIIKNLKIPKTIMTSMSIAFSTTLLSFILSVPTSFAIGRRNIRYKNLFKTIMLLPMVLPSMAIALYIGRVLHSMRMTGTYWGVVLGHLVPCISYMMRILVVSFESIPQDLIDASSNLGAGVWHRMTEVYLPMIIPGLVAGSIFTFLHSMEEFNLSFVIGAPTIRTVPTVLYGFLGEGFSATRASVVSLILMIPNLIVMMITEQFVRTEYMGAALGKM